MYLQECVVERTDQRWGAGVEAGGGKSGSSARVWRSLDVDQLVDVEPAEMGQHDNSNKSNIFVTKRERCAR
jgi:hypothetical protein